MKIEDWKHHVGTGWHPLLEQLDSELTAVFPEYNVIQVKEKWGDLRVYLESYPPGPNRVVQEIIYKYEGISSRICEFCGNPGSHTTDGGWRKTLCEHCKTNAPRLKIE